MNSLLILKTLLHTNFNLLTITKCALFERNYMHPRRICATLCNNYKPNGRFIIIIILIQIQITMDYHLFCLSAHSHIGQFQYSTIKENVATRPNIKRRRCYQKKTLTNVTEGIF